MSDLIKSYMYFDHDLNFVLLATGTEGIINAVEQILHFLGKYIASVKS